jgi:hypothetical protein
MSPDFKGQSIGRAPHPNRYDKENKKYGGGAGLEIL